MTMAGCNQIFAAFSEQVPPEALLLYRDENKNLAALDDSEGRK